jgi:hypothetical protein
MGIKLPQSLVVRPASALFRGWQPASFRRHWYDAIGILTDRSGIDRGRHFGARLWRIRGYVETLPTFDLGVDLNQTVGVIPMQALQMTMSRIDRRKLYLRSYWFRHTEATAKGLDSRQDPLPLRRGQETLLLQAVGNRKRPAPLLPPDSSSFNKWGKRGKA